MPFGAWKGGRHWLLIEIDELFLGLIGMQNYELRRLRPIAHCIRGFP